MHNNTRHVWNKNFPNGDYYNGDAVGDNVKDGTGEYYWASSGATYKGEWRNDLMHGRGVLTVPTRPSLTPEQPPTALSNTCRGYTYDGEFLAGKRAGQGTCRFGNGRQYEGEWADDQMHGRGTLTGAAGVDDYATYTGAFDRGVRSGPAGTCHYLNGDIYNGEWRDGKRHGTGELRLAAPCGSGPSSNARGAAAAAVPVLYKGPFVQDAPTTGPSLPTAEVQYSDGSSYVGGVDNLRREGEGTWRLANGDVYQGQFHLDHREGRGTLTSHDGSTYEGTWVRDKLSGRVHVKRTAASVEVGGPASGALPTLVAYQGPCVDGELSGAGARATYSDGSIYKGGARQGLPDGDGVWEQCQLRGLPPASFGDAAFFSRYEGQLSRGVPEGQGTATLQVSPSPSASFAAAAADALPPHTHGMRIVYRRRGAYTGHWSRGLPHGAGVWKWEGDEAYTGELADGVAHGHGAVKNAQETYEGGFSQGQADGEGVYEHLLLHERYDGGWSRGLFHGHGTYVKNRDGRDAAERSHYQGAWVDGQKHGEGSETVGSRCYTGSFAKGHYEGHGVLAMNGCTTLAEKTVYFASYDGAFHDGLPSGHGKMVLLDGSTVTGEFVEGIPNGPCQAQFAQGLQFDGVYVDGVPEGEGCLRYPNGDRYVGMLEPATGTADGPRSQVDHPALDLVPQRHGKGLFTFAEGNQLSCVWVHNVLNGDGVYTVAGTGEKQPRRYVDGVLCAKPGGSDENVFTPENMFPNTQSEDALKDKLVAKKRKPFAFVRKGETRQAANAPREEDGTAPDTVTSGSKRISSSQGPNGSKSPGQTTPRRTSLRSGSVDGKAVRRMGTATTAATSASVAGAQRAASKSTTTAPAEKRPHSLRERSPRQSLRGSQDPRQQSSRKSGAHTAQHTAQPASTAGRTSQSGSRELLERFQNGLMQIDAQQSKAPHELTNTDDGQSQSGVTDSVATDVQHSQGRSWASPPRGPLTGPLKAMMDEASAIRSSKEDEIHLLTEEMRQLNEKIWQLRFSLSSAEPAATNKTANHLRSDVLTARLATLNEERMGIVDKLSCLLHH